MKTANKPAPAFLIVLIAAVQILVYGSSINSVAVALTVKSQKRSV